MSSISNRHDTRKVFDAFCRLAACALAMKTREPEYLAEAGRWTRAELDTFGAALGALVLEMEARPFTDLLGPYYMEHALSSSTAQRSGEFHTPQEICRLMARMTNGTDEPTEPVHYMEPCCGGGAMILSSVEAMTPGQRKWARWTAIDINATACDMCFINTTLWHIPCRILHGNTLSGEFWSAWSNIHWLNPWLRAYPDQPEAAPDLSRALPVAQGLPPSPAEIAAVRSSLQAEFSF